MTPLNAAPAHLQVGLLDGCDCTMCRKAQGATFRSRAKVQCADFHWIAGERLLTFFESSPGNRHGFCRIGGSPILSKYDADPWIFGLPLGAFDDDPDIRPEMRVFVSRKAPWFFISDDLPQFKELPKTRGSRFAGSASSGYSSRSGRKKAYKL